MAKKQNLGELVSVEKRATDGGTLQQRVEFRYDAFGNRVDLGAKLMPLRLFLLRFVAFGSAMREGPRAEVVNE